MVNYVGFPTVPRSHNVSVKIDVMMLGFPSKSDYAIELCYPRAFRNPDGLTYRSMSVRRNLLIPAITLVDSVLIIG